MIEADVVARLVERARRGDMDAFEQLVAVWTGPMYNLAYRMVGNHEDANDLTQEIFIKVYRALGRFRGDSKFSTWLYAVATNACRSALRRIGRIASFEVTSLDAGGDGRACSRDVADPAALPDEAAMSSDMSAVVRLAIYKLPRDFRMVMVLRDIEGLGYDEIGVVMKCSVGTVKSRLARARSRVRDMLVREGIVCVAAKQQS